MVDMESQFPFGYRDAADFAPVAEAMGQLMVTLGWRTGA
jgi:hypothetical protein